MSMLSAQVDELRKAARGQKAMGLFDLAQMLKDAADTITELRGALQVASVDYRHLESENAKLRELCKAWREFAYEIFDECFGEPELNEDFMTLDDRMEALGIEVDE